MSGRSAKISLELHLISTRFHNAVSVCLRPGRSGVREHSSTELFGDYHPDTMHIRVWMRTAVRRDMTSFGTFLSTLCHEFCHHLDFLKFGFGDSWHTRASTSAPPRCITTHVELRLRNWFGRHSLASAGALIGHAQTQVRAGTRAMTIDSHEKQARQSELGQTGRTLRSRCPTRLI
jgi:hypothetical protein